MMTGGIDSILNNRMAAGRQDPQYLTNSYQKNQDLLDLLALQKLKSEKEAAKRQMLLQGGGTPPTVREQREQELVSMNKQELAQQVGGAAQQQMAQQQQAMARMMGGVGGQQVPTMMAEGGIVGYEAGGGVSRPDDEILFVDELGNPVYASDVARVANAGAIDETPEGVARRAQYATLQSGRPDLRALSAIPAAPTPTSSRGVSSPTYGMGDRTGQDNNLMGVLQGAGQVMRDALPNMPESSTNEVSLEGIVPPTRRPEQDIIDRVAVYGNDGGEPSAVERVSGELLEWAKANPADAVSLGLMLIPGVGWVGAGLRGIALAAKGLGGSGRLARGASALFTKPNPQMAFGPVQSARVFAPGRAAMTGAVGAQGVDQIANMFSGEEEPTGIATIPTAQSATTATTAPTDSGFRMQGVGQQPAAEQRNTPQPAAEQRNTPQPAPQDMGPNATPVQWLSANAPTPQTTPARETAGIGAIADQMARLQAERGDKWGAVSDWMRGVAGAKDNSLGMSLAGGADALDTRNRDLEARLSQLVDTQQKMDLAERAMGVDERGVAAEEARVAAAQAATQIEAELTREGWDRDDARAAASEAQRMITQIATANRISPAALTDVYLSAYDTAKMNGDPDPLSAAKAAVADYTSVFRAYGGSTPLTEFVGPDGE